MKKVLFSLTVLFAMGMQAQVIPNYSYTDCNNVTNDAYSELAQSKVLVIALDGIDCGICQSHAANYQNFILQNSSTIAGWGAMIWLFQGGTPTCSDVNTWVNTYSWANIFTFVDANKDFLISSAPRYIVVNPADSTVVYDGGNFNTMKQVALQYASSVSIDENEFLNDLKVFQQNDGIALQTNVTIDNNTEIRLYNLVGQEEQAWTEIENNGNGYRLTLSKNLKGGIYLLRLSNNGKQITKKLVWNP